MGPILARSASRLRPHVGWLAALFIALLAAWPLFSAPGLLNTRGGGDSPFLLQRLQGLMTALADGHFPARWLPDANYGYGYPFYNYYAPLSLYVAALFRLLGFSFVGAIKLAQLGGFLAAAGAMYALVWRWFKRPAPALLAAAAYTLAPFHMVNVYVRGDSLAEFWAMAFYPLVLLAMEGAGDAVTASVRRRAVIALGLAYAGLILSHNISALIFSPLLLLYGLFRWPARSLRSRLPALAGGALLGLSLSAWFWLPALAETGLAQTGPITEGYFHYSQHFRAGDLVQTSWLFNYDVAGGGAFRMSLIQALVIGAGLAAVLYRRRSAPRPLAFAIVAFGLATFMITPLSRPLWDRLPLLPFTQFPWRFLSIQALAGALLVGTIGLLPGRRWVTPLLLALLLAGGLGNLETEHLPLGDTDITAARLAEYEWFTGNIGTTVSAEYLPQTVNPRPQTSAWLEQGKRGEAQLTSGGDVVLRDAITDRQQWTVTAAEAGILTVPTMAWPGWTAWVDGAPVDVTPAPGSGLITVPIPAGAHVVDLRLTRTPVRLAAEWLSLLALLGAIILFARSGGRLPSRRTGVTVVAVLLLVMVGAWLWPAYEPAGPASWDFAQLGYLHRQPGGIPFAGGPVLADYVYSSETVAAGSDWTISLSWDEPGGGQGVFVDLVQPAVTRPALTRRVMPAALVSAGALVTGSEQTLVLTVPPDAPSGLYLPRLRLNDRADQPVPALTVGGQRRGDLFLAPVRVTAGRFALPAPDRDLAVTTVDVQPTTDGGLRVNLAWWTGAALSQNYNVSLRLTNNAGLVLAQIDTQPGFGFNPSSLWPAGAWQPDQLVLPLPDTLPDSQPYALTVRLYTVADQQVALTRRLGELTGPAPAALAFRPTQPLLALPAGITPLAASFGDIIDLRGFELDQVETALDVTLFWRATGEGLVDYAHFVHLVDLDSGTVVAQHDAQPRNNSYPTSQWTTGEFVSDPARLDVAELSPGRYALVVGLYEPVAPFTRLRLAGGDDQVLLTEIDITSP